MERFRETWTDMVVQTTSPNGCVFLSNHGDRDFRITFDDAWFHRASLDDVTGQLVGLFRVALVERTQAYNRHKEMVTGQEITPIDGSRNPHIQSFVEQRDSLAVEGTSADGLVTITSVGLTRFAVTIDQALWSRRDRLAVQRARGEAANSLVGDQFRKMYELKQAGH